MIVTTCFLLKAREGENDEGQPTSRESTFCHMLLKFHEKSKCAVLNFLRAWARRDDGNNHIKNTFKRSSCKTA